MVTRIKTDEGIAKDVVDSLYWDSRVDASSDEAMASSTPLPRF